MFHFKFIGWRESLAVKNAQPEQPSLHGFLFNMENTWSWRGMFGGVIRMSDYECTSNNVSELCKCIAKRMQTWNKAGEDDPWKNWKLLRKTHSRRSRLASISHFYSIFGLLSSCIHSYCGIFMRFLRTITTAETESSSNEWRKKMLCKWELRTVEQSEHMCQLSTPFQFPFHSSAMRQQMLHNQIFIQWGKFSSWSSARVESVRFWIFFFVSIRNSQAANVMERQGKGTKFPGKARNFTKKTSKFFHMEKSWDAKDTSFGIS